MNILLVGGGGREHAIAVKLAENSVVKRIYCAPGNGGTAGMSLCQNIELSAIPELVAFAKEHQVGLTIVGPEELLVQGIADAFEAEGLPLFGPKAAAAKLEGSKAFAKDFMIRNGVRTAIYKTFTSSQAADSYLDTLEEFPVVVKADGLASGKGVLICPDRASAKETVNSMINEGLFQDAGKTIVIEEFLEGVEASILSFCDGRTILPMISAKDHKRALDGDQGENTGGMGAVAPNPHITDENTKDFVQRILYPTLEGLQKEEIDFKGIIFFGLMLTDKGVYLIEYNVRMGDPETQAVLPLLSCDLLELFQATINQELEETDLWWKPGYSCCVTMVSGGYPGNYQTGFPIDGLDQVETTLYLAGAALSADAERLVTTGGRVLNVVGVAESPQAARQIAYKELEKIRFDHSFYRKDIGEN